MKIYCYIITYETTISYVQINRLTEFPSIKFTQTSKIIDSEKD